ncbi:MAG: hypothetical protein ACK5EA_18610 [Planctomycetaceae bacterium]
MSAPPGHFDRPDLPPSLQGETVVFSEVQSNQRGRLVLTIAGMVY